MNAINDRLGMTEIMYVTKRFKCINRNMMHLPSISEFSCSVGLVSVANGTSMEVL